MSTTTDTLFAPLTIATAPEASRPALEKIQESLGYIPNLMAIFANNPTVLQGYLALDAVFEKGSFTPRGADHPAGCECGEPLQLLRGGTFHNREGRSTHAC
jgi:hypothetical protein